MIKQTPYVIINDKEEMFAGMNGTHIWWTPLITSAEFFNNISLAKRANKQVNGTIQKLNYKLTNI